MFQSCPHCHELVSIGLPNTAQDTLCPRCGGVVQAATPAAEPETPPAAGGRGAPSLASFLQPRAEPATVPADEARIEVAPAPIGTAQAADTDTDPEPTHGDDVATSPIAAVDPAASQSEPPLAAESTTPATQEPAQPVADLAIAAEADDHASNTAHLAPPAVAAAELQAPDAADQAVPSFTQDILVVQPGPAPWQWLAMLVLAVALLLQVILADRARLASDPAWRPLLLNLCGILGCTLPPWREPGAFTMLSRDVRPLAGVPGALQAQATFRNEARWAQAWPLLLVSLSDADGRVVGARVFRPDEYLAEATQAGLAPGQSAQVVLQLREPDASVVAFAFDFR